ncbi:ferric reductase NAD binding domain-containing protein [Diplogelasinospora grovesii]|uniref:Ferric reductase NAD binding domain-containing protein n=1 Tax=Diplogelasinospora grovesii TaxID=303347 RepID=A0AAN6NAS9_9PEZI|nr:ferric reductase NAD binding domain-containing protein [Diplogelasinospora grovesii]
MGWPYQFLDLSKADKHLRRQTLDRYAFYAQLTALLPIILILGYRIVTWAIKAVQARNGAYAAIPNSPALKVARLSSSGSRTARVRRLQWWLGGEVVAFGRAWGHRDQWVVGSAWTGWMLLLCVLGTGQDYLHLTKRFGIIAASQYPIQYLLALKSLNPFAYAFRSSHEQVNRWHRVLGRVIYFLLCLHVIFYLNYFVQGGILKQRLLAPVVAFGVVAFLGLNLLSAIALRTIRRFSYRLFFITHLIVALAMPPLLLLHAKPAKVFMIEAIVVFIADLVSRKLDTVTAHATLEHIPGTTLVKMTASVPYTKVNRFREHPGSHIYLSFPAAARLHSDPTSISYLLFEFLFNPFTVAAVDEETGDLTLVARHLGGPMTAALARFAGVGKPGPTRRPSNANGTTSNEDKVPLYIEGPYGCVRHFPTFSSGDFDRILLVAGGIGATFTVPLYRSMLQENPNAKVEMVWAVRGAGDATWAVAANDPAKGLMNDDNVHIFLTGDILSADPSGISGSAKPNASSSSRNHRRVDSNGEGSSSITGGANNGNGDSGEVEMSAMYRDRRRNKYTSQHNRKRPDLKRIVDDVFRHGQEERVAVMVCGPEEMARELRYHVGVWVMKGRTVWFHNESFGY